MRRQPECAMPPCVSTAHLAAAGQRCSDHAAVLAAQRLCGANELAQAAEAHYLRQTVGGRKWELISH